MSFSNLELLVPRTTRYNVKNETSENVNMGGCMIMLG